MNNTTYIMHDFTDESDRIFIAWLYQGFSCSCRETALILQFINIPIKFTVRNRSTVGCKIGIYREIPWVLMHNTAMHYARTILKHDERAARISSLFIQLGRTPGAAQASVKRKKGCSRETYWIKKVLVYYKSQRANTEV